MSSAAANARTFADSLSGHHANFRHFFKKNCFCKESLIFGRFRRAKRLGKAKAPWFHAVPIRPQNIMRLNRFSLFAGLCGCLVSSLAAQDKLNLRTHYESGKVYTMENVMEMTTSIPGAPAGGGGQETNMTQTMTIAVKDEPGGTGNRLATVKFTGIKAKMKMMGQTMEYDSADAAKSQPFLQQAFGALVGKEFTLVYDKEDKIVDARGLDNIASTPVGGAKGMDGKALMESFKKSQEMFLPPQPVGPGDTWNYDGKIDMQPMGTMVVKGTGKFDSVADKHAKVLVDGTISMPENGNPMAKIGEGSTTKVEMFYDIDRRLADTTNTSNDIKLSAAGQEIPMKQKVTTKITKVEDAAK